MASTAHMQGELRRVSRLLSKFELLLIRHHKRVLTGRTQ